MINHLNAQRPKMTKILATLGPVSAKASIMLDLLAAGVDAFRQRLHTRR